MIKGGDKCDMLRDVKLDEFKGWINVDMMDDFEEEEVVKVEEEAEE